MKKMKNITLIVALFLTTTVFGQKLGHINSNELLMAMPERTTIENEIKKTNKLKNESIKGSDHTDYSLNKEDKFNMPSKSHDK